MLLAAYFDIPESEEDTKGNCRDETEENNNISDEG